MSGDYRNINNLYRRISMQTEIFNNGQNMMDADDLSLIPTASSK